MRAKRAKKITIFTLRNRQKCLQMRHKNDPLVPICPLKYHIKRFSREARRKFSGFRRVNRGICMILSREARRKFFGFLRVNTTENPSPCAENPDSDHRKPPSAYPGSGTPNPVGLASGPESHRKAPPLLRAGSVDKGGGGGSVSVSGDT